MSELLLSDLNRSTLVEIFMKGSRPRRYCFFILLNKKKDIKTKSRKKELLSLQPPNSFDTQTST